MRQIQEELWPSTRPQVDTTTFLRNRGEPIHRWFRYSAGFSASWVNEVIQEAKSRQEVRVLDPFAGSGTVLLEAERCGVSSFGLEVQPFVARITRAKLLWRSNPNILEKYAQKIIAVAKAISSDTSVYPSLTQQCYPAPILEALDQLRRGLQEVWNDAPESELAWLALASILRLTSPVGTASWQYVLPKKSKANTNEPFQAFVEKIRQMASDMRLRQAAPYGPQAILLEQDARTCAGIPDEWVTLVVTSPPYANNFDYADFTRLEMSFFLEIRGWGDLQAVARQNLVRSCTQHVAALHLNVEELLSDPVLDPIASEVKEVCAGLGQEKALHGGKKQYDIMIASYFADLARVWAALRRCCAPEATVCFVVGDSAPYGVHVPVERWLGELAVASGFRSWRFEKLRDRNTKWKNRKHRVLLHEGRLWVHG